MSNNNRKSFRQAVFSRDDHTCIVPWCQNTAVDAHHILERELWSNGGYTPQNGVSVCERHHKRAEDDLIPPQAFYNWAGIEDPPLPNSVETIDVDKWGNELDTPPHEELRDYHKYPSTRHLPYSHVEDRDDTRHQTLDKFVGVPLVCTVKMDGSNAMLVKDMDEPVRSRRGRDATHDSFDQLKQLYWEKNVYDALPSHLQIFGEWLYAKHSIHYGCDGSCPDECDKRNQGPALDDYFQVFGVFNTKWNLWLSWDAVEYWANEIGFSTTPVVFTNKTFDRVDQIYDLYSTGEQLVQEGHEGFVIRSQYPFHYGQFGQRLGKYVRENHVQTDDHWAHTEIVQNNTTN